MSSTCGLPADNGTNPGTTTGRRAAAPAADCTFHRANRPGLQDSGLQRLTEAIDGLALAVQAAPGGEAGVTDLPERLAALWAMVADLDPAVAARVAGYVELAGQRPAAGVSRAPASRVAGRRQAAGVNRAAPGRVARRRQAGGVRTRRSLRRASR